MRVDILVCTYKRPELLKSTLNGIEQLDDTGLKIRVIVVDNDSNESARVQVESHRQNSRFTCIYKTQPVQNISLTRNCALDASDADYVALIDDDETPDSGWLNNLLQTAQTYQTPLVFGPVLSEYEDSIPRWIIEGRFFEFRTRDITGAKVSLSNMRTGNVLISRQLIKKTQIRFDPLLGLSGGEDYDFFLRLLQSGTEGVWCDEATVHEWVPCKRATAEWLLKRAFRIGSVAGYSRRRSRKLASIAIILAKGMALFLLGSFKTLIWSFLSKHRCVQALQKLCLGLGMIFGVLHGPYSEYRNAST